MTGSGDKDSVVDTMRALDMTELEAVLYLTIREISFFDRYNDATMAREIAAKIFKHLPLETIR